MPDQGPRATTQTESTSIGRGLIYTQGDSLMLYGEKPLERLLGRDIVYDAQAGRMTSTGVDRTVSFLRSHPNANIALMIMALGTNNILSPPEYFREAVRRFKRAAINHGGVTKVLWVNTFYRGHKQQYDRINKIISEEFDNVVDWASFAEGGNVHLPDGIHAYGEEADKRWKLIAEATGEAISDDLESGAGNIGGIGGSGASLEQAFTAAKATAFAVELSFPGEMERFEAAGLQGQKSMLNDKPLFEFIQQLTGACLRDFQSLPNGDFYAFYPNYFGTFQSRDPYWNIYDIELTEGSIELNDESLATHVYVVGDTMLGGGIDAFEKMVTGGVVTLHNVAQSGFHTNKEEPGKRKENTETGDPSDEEIKRYLNLTDTAEVITFLQKYGARPHYDEAPNVRNSFYEAFLAYQTFQTLWAKQFSTQFKFTFMPELFPSGTVAFPDHDLQCYIQEVTHSFDYQHGFHTEAILTAPATLGDKLPDDPLKHGLVKAGSYKGDS